MIKPARLGASLLLLVSFACVASEADENCGAQPEPPPLPEGVSFSEAQLKAEKKRFMTYQDENAIHLDCLLDLMDSLQAEIGSIGEGSAGAKDLDALESEFALAGSAYNKAVATEDDSAAQINTAINDFKEK